jgi:hypothetical protein
VRLWARVREAQKEKSPGMYFTRPVPKKEKSPGMYFTRPVPKKKKAPAYGPGQKSLIAVITVRLLLREEKQGTTTLRLSFTGNFIR